MSEEQIPVNPALKVIEHIDIYHTEKWWKAAVITEGWGKKIVSVYQWIKDQKTGKWKRKQKMTVKNAEEWAKIQKAIEQLLEKL